MSFTYTAVGRIDGCTSVCESSFCVCAFVCLDRYVSVWRGVSVVVSLVVLVCL